MKKILILTGILILVFTAAAFADGTTTAQLTVSPVATITGTSNAAISVIDTSYSNTWTADAAADAAFTIKSNHTYTVSFSSTGGTYTGHGAGNIAHLAVKTGATTYVQTGSVTTGSATNGANYTPTFRLEDVTYTSVDTDDSTKTIVATFTIAQP